MKKCSHSTHHALAELNITPLLDLAFVLLVIFIITTTPVVNDLDVDLPSAANKPKEAKPKVNYVTVESSGKIFLNSKEVTLATLSDEMITLRLDDPDLNVTLRGSAKTKYRSIITVMNALQEASVLKVNLATEPVAEGSPSK